VTPEEEDDLLRVQNTRARVVVLDGNFQSSSSSLRIVITAVMLDYYYAEVGTFVGKVSTTREFPLKHFSFIIITISIVVVVQLSSSFIETTLKLTN